MFYSILKHEIILFYHADRIQKVCISGVTFTRSHFDAMVHKTPSWGQKSTPFLWETLFVNIAFTLTFIQMTSNFVTGAQMHDG